MKPLFAVQHIDEYIDRLYIKVTDFIPNFLTAIAILITGIILIKIFRKVITRIMNRKEDMDPTALKFILDVCTWIFRALIFVTIIQQLGVETTSFVAAIGAAGLAVGLSLQGSLSNFAGGLLIILFKPFRVGDYIEAQGHAGTVNSIQIFSTRITTSTNQVVYLPNGTLSNNTIKNFSQEPLRRADILLRVGYNNDLKEVKDVLYTIIKSDSKVLSNPTPNIEVKDLAESFISLNVMIWTERENHGTVVSDFLENAKAALQKAKIEIPNPQRDIHIKNDNPEKKS